MRMDATVIWKTIDIKGHGYRVSSKGDIISLPFVTSGCVKGKTKERKVSPYIDKGGFANVDLAGKTYKVHYLIASLFIDNPFRLPHVIFIDGNKLNYSASNLRWSDSISKSSAIKLIPYFSFSLSDIPGEVWQTIDGTNNIYKVSSYGRVKSYYRKEKILSPRLNSDGYVKVAIIVNGRRKDFLVHRLVLESFYEKKDNYEIDHIDGNRANNNINNLRYVTHTENVNNPLTLEAFKKRISPMKGRFGKNNPLSKPIYAINPEGKRIDFEGLWDADRKGYRYNNVSYCLHHPGKTYRGLSWFFR